MTDDEGQVELRLSADEALVLSDLLYRWIDQEHGRTIAPLVVDDAEIWVLNGLNCSLERVVATVFQLDYATGLSAARERESERCGGRWPSSFS